MRRIMERLEKLENIMDKSDKKNYTITYQKMEDGYRSLSQKFRFMSGYESTVITPLADQCEKVSEYYMQKKIKLYVITAMIATSIALFIRSSGIG